ncbi:MAG: serine hydrolase domain-containing protein [Bacteroidota bacterium]
MKKIILLLSIVFNLVSCKQNQKTNTGTKDVNHSIEQELTAKLDSIVSNGKIIGVGVTMVNQNRVLYSNGFGYADKEAQIPYTKNTIQHIASVSKTLIGIALFKAQEMGKLNIDDPIEKHLPFKVVNPSFPMESITIRHLAQHTSGINDTEQYMDNAWILKKGQDLTQISTEYPAQRLNPPEKEVPMDVYLKEYLMVGGNYYQADNFINFRPGQRYNYSNIGATLAALVLEKATGMSFSDFTKEHILIPLDMTSSGWFLEHVDKSKHSKLYRNDYSLLPLYGAITYPDGMLITSPSDMGKYLTELIKGYSGNGTLLSADSYANYFKEQLKKEHFESRNADNPYNEDYSPALFIGHSALGYIGHSGGDAGVGTWMFFNKEKKTGRFIVINTDTGNDNREKELEYYSIWDTMDSYLEKLGK